ncbi:MAG: hypothetical protein DSO04_07585 [Hadesarchaea archaeon]|nr:MAG: hypothetical protein DSO04_07585 [Hadesarchaea archaeon]
MRVGIVSDGKYGERARERLKERFGVEWILVDYPSSQILDEVQLELPPCDLYLSYVRHPDVALEVASKGVPTLLGVSFGEGFLRQARERNPLVLAPPTLCSLEGNTGVRAFDEFARFFGKPRFELEVRGGKLVRLRLLRESPCGSTREASSTLEGRPASPETVRYFGLRVGENCRAPTFGRTCDRELAEVVQARELARALVEAGAVPAEEFESLVREMEGRYAQRERLLLGGVRCGGG